MKHLLWIGVLLVALQGAAQTDKYTGKYVCVNEWCDYEEVIKERHKLKLNTDSTFTYKNSAEQFSGIWTLTKDSLLLHRTTEKDTVYYLKHNITDIVWYHRHANNRWEKGGTFKKKK